MLRCGVEGCWKRVLHVGFYIILQTCRYIKKVDQLQQVFYGFPIYGGENHQREPELWSFNMLI